MHRRAELGEKINERYAAALATVEDQTPLGELARDLGKPTTWKGRSVRALNPLAPADVELLEAINRGRVPAQRFSQPRPACAAVRRRSIGEPRGSQAAGSQGDAVAPSASCPWRDHQGPQDTPLPGVARRPKQGDCTARSPAGQHRTITQSRMRKRVRESAHHAKKSNVSRTENTETDRRTDRRILTTKGTKGTKGNRSSDQSGRVVRSVPVHPALSDPFPRSVFVSFVSFVFDDPNRSSGPCPRTDRPRILEHERHEGHERSRDPRREQQTLSRRSSPVRPMCVVGRGAVSYDDGAY